MNVPPSPLCPANPTACSSPELPGGAEEAGKSGGWWLNMTAVIIFGA